jgi:hypothetical protein
MIAVISLVVPGWIDIALSFAEVQWRRKKDRLAKMGYQIPSPISVMLSASQPNRPTAIIVSRLVEDSACFSD